MPKSIITHKDPLATNMIKRDWPNATLAKPKLNQLQKHRTDRLDFTT